MKSLENTGAAESAANSQKHTGSGSLPHSLANHVARIVQTTRQSWLMPIEASALTQEHRAKLAAVKLGIKRDPYALMTCPHCGKTGGGGTMKRWHFDNCKVKHG